MDISGKIFRRMPRAWAFRPGHDPVAGRGLVVRLKAEAGSHTDGLRHGTGALCAPLFVFTGALEGAAPGDILEQEGLRYTVLKAEPMEIAGTGLGIRLVLERQVDEDAGS